MRWHLLLEPGIGLAGRSPPGYSDRGRPACQAKYHGHVNGELLLGDNLAILERMQELRVDLVYLDPPFNSGAVYAQTGSREAAFSDRWRWDVTAERSLTRLGQGAAESDPVPKALSALEILLGRGPLLAYLVALAPRLAAARRVLKDTGSLYLHCDPRSGPYLRVLLDAVFGPRGFRSEIVWRRNSAHSDGKQGHQLPGRVHDTILFYTKTSRWTWNPQYTPYDAVYIERFYRHVEPGTGRRYRLGDLTGPGGIANGNPQYDLFGVTRPWRYSPERMATLAESGRIVQSRPGAVPCFKRYLDEMPGVPLQDVWADIRPVGAHGAERTGYPTQKPVALVERIIASSSHPEDLVLDPFCGSGTTLVAAERLGRRWIGIDSSPAAVAIARARLEAVRPPGSN